MSNTTILKYIYVKNQHLILIKIYVVYYFTNITVDFQFWI